LLLLLFSCLLHTHSNALSLILSLPLDVVFIELCLEYGHRYNNSSVVKEILALLDFRGNPASGRDARVRETMHTLLDSKAFGQVRKALAAPLGGEKNFFGRSAIARTDATNPVVDEVFARDPAGRTVLSACFPREGGTLSSEAVKIAMKIVDLADADDGTEASARSICAVGDSRGSPMSLAAASLNVELVRKIRDSYPPAVEERSSDDLNQTPYQLVLRKKGDSTLDMGTWCDLLEATSFEGNPDAVYGGGAECEDRAAFIAMLEAEAAAAVVAERKAQEAKEAAERKAQEAKEAAERKAREAKEAAAAASFAKAEASSARDTSAIEEDDSDDL